VDGPGWCVLSSGDGRAGWSVVKWFTGRNTNSRPIPARSLDVTGGERVTANGRRLSEAEWVLAKRDGGYGPYSPMTKQENKAKG
jgi:hypothetical protein